MCQLWDFGTKERENIMSKSMTNDQLLIREYVKQQYAALQFSDQAAYFEFLAASQALREYDLSDEEIEAGLTGSGGDGGCDGVYLFFNDVLVGDDYIDNLSSVPREATLNILVVQAKNELGFGEDAIMKWKVTSANLLQFENQIGSFSGRYTEKVLTFFQNFKDLRIKLLTSKVKLIFKYVYVAVANDLHPNVQAQADELCEQIHQLFPGAMTSVEVEFVNASKLMELINTQTSQQFNLPLADNPIAIGSKKDYIALVNLGNYYKFITDETGALRKYIFESNIRDYQGHNNVNNEIRETLAAETPEDFWWLNNGVTIIAEDVSQAISKQLLIINPEIVNGLQTSNEIYFHFHEHPELIEQETRNVLLRIVVPEDESSRDRIILATNSQTTIPAVALRSTDPIHRQIEMYFKSRGLYYDRRKNYYKNQGKKASEIVSIGFLGQCLMSLFLGKPNYARARPSTLLSNDDYYKKLYIDNTDLELFYRSASLGKKVERYIKSSSDYSQAVKSDILFYVIYTVVAQAVQSPDISSLSFKALDMDAIDEIKISQAAQLVFKLYQELGGNNKVAKGSELLERIRTEIVE